MFFSFIKDNKLCCKEPVSTDTAETTLKTATVTGTANVYNIADVGTLYDGMPLTARFDTASTGLISVTINGGTTAYPIVDHMGNGFATIGANCMMSMRYDAVNGNFRSLVERREDLLTNISILGAYEQTSYCKERNFYPFKTTAAKIKLKISPVEANATITAMVNETTYSIIPNTSSVAIQVLYEQCVFLDVSSSNGNKRRYVLYREAY